MEVLNYLKYPKNLSHLEKCDLPRTVFSAVRVNSVDKVPSIYHLIWLLGLEI